MLVCFRDCALPLPWRLWAEGGVARAVWVGKADLVLLG